MKASGTIRVLLVDSSPVALERIGQLLTDTAGIEVAGKASSTQAGLELIRRLQPDVICASVPGAVVDGREFINRIMDRLPRPVLVMGEYGMEEGTGTSALIEAGAVNVWVKPASFFQQSQVWGKRLVEKIKISSGVYVIPKTIRFNQAPKAPSHPGYKILAIGASTGGPRVLQNIFKRLPGSYPLPILCVQHISEGFLEGMVNWLNSSCALRVGIGRDGELPIGGRVYFPPEDKHLEIDVTGRISITRKLPFQGHRPSVTVTFNAVAAHYNEAAIGVLLSGMGDDGALGMQALAQQRGLTIGQDEDSCDVFGMPKEAIALGVVRHILPPDRIAAKLIQLSCGE